MCGGAAVVRVLAKEGGQNDQRVEEAQDAVAVHGWLVFLLLAELKLEGDEEEDDQGMEVGDGRRASCWAIKSA